MSLSDVAHRVLGYRPRMAGKPWPQAAVELDRILRKLWHAHSGVPGGFKNVVPNPTGAVGSAGTDVDSWMAANAIVPQGIVTTKGDLLGHSTVPARVPVGANDQVLVADSAQALGLKWGDASSISTEWAKIFMTIGAGE